MEIFITEDNVKPTIPQLIMNHDWNNSKAKLERAQSTGGKVQWNEFDWLIVKRGKFQEAEVLHSELKSQETYSNGKT